MKESLLFDPQDDGEPPPSAHEQYTQTTDYVREHSWLQVASSSESDDAQYRALIDHCREQQTPADCAYDQLVVQRQIEEQQIREVHFFDELGERGKLPHEELEAYREAALARQITSRRKVGRGLLSFFLRR